ncbi:MAG: hypothetical protein JJ966_06495 [Balneolaceae bacterium]|nr:hypothetical protein [Balneolaceae bacterium]
MSYAIRNTLILLVTLFLILGLGFSYSKFFLESKVEDLENSLVAKRNDLASKEDINIQFTELNERYQAALEVISNYDKILFSSNKPDDVFDFLNRVNAEGGNQMYYDYIYTDSIPSSEYGIIESSIAGFGRYDALTDFVNRIEHSQLLNKVSNLTISPARQDDDLHTVNFSFELESYYEKTNLFDSLGRNFSINLDEEISNYNPLFPLIQPTVQANVNGLTDIRGSRLIGMTDNRVFVRDQTGRIISLKQGDRVYLGSLVSIDLQNKKATFNLDVGGIEEVVTLEVVR